MTAVTLNRTASEQSQRLSPKRRWRFSSNHRRRSSSPTPRPGVAPLTPRLQVVRAVLVLVFVVSFSLLVQLFLVSSLQHSAAQGRQFASFRAQLAGGTAPIGPTDADGRELAIGTPIAYLEIPSIGLKEVVGQGTTASALYNGPGHRRDTPIPGQIGTSVIFGRRAAFGGPFSDLDELRPKALVMVTTGQGVFTYRVLGVRREGDVAPAPPPAGMGRLLLVTAAGSAFLPSGVLRVDAELESEAVVGATPLIASASLPTEERVMSSDSRTLWALALWLQALIGLAVGLAWAWHRWGRAQSWVVFLPPLLLVGVMATGEAARLLPNLL